MGPQTVAGEVSVEGGRSSRQAQRTVRRTAVFLLFLAALMGPELLLGSQRAEAAVYLLQAAPDWNQPYRYAAPFGPGPGPGTGKGPYDAWCAPTSAAGLLGYWEDGLGVPLADGFPFSAGPAAVPWPTPAIWHDRSLGDPRSAPGPVGTFGLTDLGWWMDTNNSGYSGWGNPPHAGTYVKDVHLGLVEALGELAANIPGLPTAWWVATQGAALAFGTSTAGHPATVHASSGSAWSEVASEIKMGRPILIHWSHWAIVPLGPILPPGSGTGAEAGYGGTFFDFGPPPAAGDDPWDNGEVWSNEGEGPETSLGHTTLAVGFIQAGDPDDPLAATNPTDWVIVHDNVHVTPRNVIVPLSPTTYGAGVWVANTTVTPAVAVAPLLAEWALVGLVMGVLIIGLLGLSSRSFSLS